jgi:hypothetical protein
MSLLPEPTGPPQYHPKSSKPQTSHFSTGSTESTLQHPGCILDQKAHLNSTKPFKSPQPFTFTASRGTGDQRN